MYDLPGAYIRDFVELTARWKVKPARLVDGLPVTLDALADPATRVPLQVCEAIVARGVALTKEPALGVHLGMQRRGLDEFRNESRIRSRARADGSNREREDGERDAAQ